MEMGQVALLTCTPFSFSYGISATRATIGSGDYQLATKHPKELHRNLLRSNMNLKAALPSSTEPL
jgi:hypothetical protein